MLVSPIPHVRTDFTFLLGNCLGNTAKGSSGLRLGLRQNICPYAKARWADVSFSDRPAIELIPHFSLEVVDAEWPTSEHGTSSRLSATSWIPQCRVIAPCILLRQPSLAALAFFQ